MTDQAGIKQDLSSAILRYKPYLIQGKESSQNSYLLITVLKIYDELQNQTLIPKHDSFPTQDIHIWLPVPMW
jgi:hypothetical protein